MKKLSYLFVSIAFLGFLTFSCGDSAKKANTETPVEEVIEEQVDEEMVDSTAVDVEMDAEVETEEVEETMGE